MSGATPGPWRAALRQKTSNFGARLIRVDNWPAQPRRTICTIAYREPNEAAEADAKLIAAAPSLRDLLREAVDALIEELAAAEPYEDHPVLMRHAGIVDRAMAALSLVGEED